MAVSAPVVGPPREECLLVRREEGGVTGRAAVVAVDAPRRRSLRAATDHLGGRARLFGAYCSIIHGCRLDLSGSGIRTFLQPSLQCVAYVRLVKVMLWSGPGIRTFLQPSLQSLAYVRLVKVMLGSGRRCGWACLL